MPLNYNPFFMSNLLANAGKSALDQLNSSPSQRLTNAVGNTSMLASDIASGFARGVRNETQRQSMPSQGLTNFVGSAKMLGDDIDSGFYRGIQNGIRNESRPSQGLTNFVGGVYTGFTDAMGQVKDGANELMRYGNNFNYIPPNAGFIPVGDGSYVPATPNEIRGFNYVTNVPFEDQPLNPETGYQSTQPQRVGLLTQKPQAQMSQTVQPMARPTAPAAQPQAQRAPKMSKVDADELSKLRLYSAVPNQNMFSISDASGNRGWAGIGDKVNGWSVKSYDKGFVTVEKNGITARVGLQGSSPTEYTPPANNSKDSAVGAGTMSSYDQQLADGMGDTSWLKIPESEKKMFEMTRDVFDNVVKNAQQSPYMSDEQKKNIMHFADYNNMRDQIPKGKRIFVPRMDKSGNIDFDIFVNDEGE
jgi:hypothetical protein